MFCNSSTWTEHIFIACWQLQCTFTNNIHKCTVSKLKLLSQYWWGKPNNSLDTGVKCHHFQPEVDAPTALYLTSCVVAPSKKITERDNFDWISNHWTLEITTGNLNPRTENLQQFTTDASLRPCFNHFIPSKCKERKLKHFTTAASFSPFSNHFNHPFAP